MTDTTRRDELVETITREVLAALAAGAAGTAAAGTAAAGGPGGSADPGDPCATCTGGCAARCAPKVRDVVAGGAARVEYHGRAADVPTDLARYIDHTLLRPDAVAADIDQLCAEAAEHRFAAVCINPTWVRRAADNLRGTEVAVASVVGFPFGATPPDIKAFEARRAIRDGAGEIDMVINIGALKSGMAAQVREDIARVTDACHESGATCKVIIETALLSDEEKVVACRLAQQAKADFVKTSTGYAKGGATVFDVALMREAVGPRMGVKAAGGIRTAEDVEDMIAAGATRIGASAGVRIVTGGKGAHGQY
jgi:deoxyribose-phosphate aldolase